MAKELDWKSSKAATPRGFESHVLRHKKIKQRPFGRCFIFCERLNGTRTHGVGENVPCGFLGFCKKCWGGGYLNIFQSPFLFKK